MSFDKEVKDVFGMWTMPGLNCVLLSNIVFYWLPVVLCERVTVKIGTNLWDCSAGTLTPFCKSEKYGSSTRVKPFNSLNYEIRGDLNHGAVTLVLPVRGGQHI